MNDWNEYREQLALRLRELSKLAPEFTFLSVRDWSGPRRSACGTLGALDHYGIKEYLAAHLKS